VKARNTSDDRDDARCSSSAFNQTIDHDLHDGKILLPSGLEVPSEKTD